MTFSYKSKRKAIPEGPEDMGATMQLETEPEKKVGCMYRIADWCSDVPALPHASRPCHYAIMICNIIVIM